MITVTIIPAMGIIMGKVNKYHRKNDKGKTLLSGLLPVFLILCSAYFLFESASKLPVEISLSQYLESRKIIYSGNGHSRLSDTDRKSYLDTLKSIYSDEKVARNRDISGLYVQVLMALPARQAVNEHRSDLEQALEIQEQSLRYNPADTYGWARLAWLRRVLNGANGYSLSALSLSNMVAPYEPPLMVSRIVEYYRHQHLWNEQIKQSMPLYLRKAYKASRKNLIKKSEEYGFKGDLDHALYRKY